MIKMMIEGILHIVHVRKDSNKPTRVARVHTINNEPIKVLKEVRDNEFHDDVENKMYRLNPMTRVIVGA